MKDYHKIQTVFKRDPETKFKTLLEGNFTLPAFEFLQNNEWSFTEKVDGTNIRVMLDEKMHFGGKTDSAQIPTQLINRLSQRFNEAETSITTNKQKGTTKIVPFLFQIPAFTLLLLFHPNSWQLLVPDVIIHVIRCRRLDRDALLIIA